MAVKIRLKQQGSANRHTFRVVAVDEAKKRDGKVIATLGFINPLKTPTEVQLDHDQINNWIKKGAQPTEAVAKLLKNA